jgi:replicative DNA helicase
MSFVAGQPTSAPTADELLGQLAGDSTPPAAAPWEGEPVPLSAHRLLPPFPLDALPSWLADMVAGLADFTQTPPDLPGCLAVACLATAAGGRAMVEVRPGWREPTNVFVVVALPPGSRKSPVFAAMTAPILAAERALQENTAPLRARAEVEARAAHAHAAEAARTADSAYATEHGAKAIDDAADAKAAADQLAVPPVPRLVADDITPEAAASLLAEQGGRLAVLSAEGGIFATLAGRYSGQPNLEVFLKGHAGDLLVVDRKGRDSEHITRPALTLGLAVQPEVLRDIAAMPGFRGRGLLARILYSLPATTVGRRRVGTPPPDQAVATAYKTNLRALVLTLSDRTEPVVLPLTRDANDAMLHLEETIEPRLHPDRGDLAPIVDWAAKYAGATARLAGLIHLAAHRDALTRPISVQTTQAATRLGHYYLGHALAVFDLMGADPIVDNAHHVLDWIARTATTKFTRRDLFTAVSRGRFRKVTELDPVLDLLDQHGYIRPRELPPRAGAGRPPSPTFDVHPDAAETAESAQLPTARLR